MFIDFSNSNPESKRLKRWTQWRKYADCKDQDWLRQPSEWTHSALKLLPNNINEIYDFGCGNGRNFIPFFEKGFKLRGYDIHPEEEIKWATEFDNLEYVRCSIEKFVDDDYMFDKDLTNAVVMTAGVLMYVGRDIQEKFLNKIKASGCKNYMFFEHDPDSRRPDGVFLLPREHFNEIKGSNYPKSPGVLYYKFATGA
jgi:SAM-dependent methyltransferase